MGGSIPQESTSNPMSMALELMAAPMTPGVTRHKGSSPFASRSVGAPDDLPALADCRCGDQLCIHQRLLPPV